MIFFYFDLNVFGFLEKNFQQSFQNCNLRVQVNFRGKAREEVLVFFFFLELGQTNLNFRLTTPSKLYFRCPQQHFEEIYVFPKNRKFTFFGVSSKQFRVDCQNCLLCVHSHFLSNWKTKFSRYVRKKLGGIDGTACYMSEGNFWFERLYSKKNVPFVTIFGVRVKRNFIFLMKFTRKFCRNCIVSVHGNI